MVNPHPIELANLPLCSCSYMAALLLLIFLDEGQKQPDNKGQDRKLDHDHLIIRHYAHPLFFSESGAIAHHVGTFLQGILYQIAD